MQKRKVCDNCQRRIATHWVIPRPGVKMAMLALCKVCYVVFVEAVGDE